MTLGLAKIAISSLLKASSSNEKIGSSSSYQPATLQQEEEQPPMPPSKDSTPKEHVSYDEEAKTPETKPSFSPNLTTRVEKVNKLRELYGQDKNFINYLVSNWILTPDHLPLDTEITDFLLLTHEEFLALSLEEIDSFSRKKLRYAYERLLYVDKYLQLAPSPYNKKLHAPLQLATLRNMDAVSLIATSVPDSCLGMLTCSQIQEFFLLRIWSEKRRDATFVEKLLPENDYTCHRLDQIKIEALIIILSDIPITRFRYIPLACFLLPTFPWQKIISKRDVELALPFNTEVEREFTTDVLKGMDITTVQRLAPFLSCAHIPLFPESTLKHPDFPWSEFIKKMDIGRALHLLSPQLLIEIQDHIPWMELTKINYGAEISSFLRQNPIGEETKEQLEDFIREFFSRLSIKNIQALIKGLPAKLLLFFPDNLLRNQDFPWSECVNKKGIGNVLREFPSQFLIEIQSHIPWTELVNAKHNGIKGIEAKHLFHLKNNMITSSESDATFIKNILTHLEWKAIEAILPCLSKKHLPLFGDRLQNPAFPWHVVPNFSLALKHEAIQNMLETVRGEPTL